MKGRRSQARWVALAGLAAVGLLSGCAELQVQVDIINPGYVVDEVEYFRIERAFLRYRSSDPLDVDAQIDQLREQYRTAMLELAQIYDADAAKDQNPKNKQRFTDSAEDLRNSVQAGGATSVEFEQLRSDLQRLDDEIRTKALKPDAYNSEGKLSTELQNLVLRRVQRDKTFRADKLADMRFRVEATDAPAAAASRPAVVNASIALRSAIGSGSLVRSDYAFFVADAPDSAWKFEFNRAFGSGKFGNSDIAIKLGEDGDFSVKGLTFDPSTVAAVAGKVTTQALLVAAQISGVPVQTKALAAGTPTPGFLATGDVAAETENTLATREAFLENQHRAIEGLALAVLHEESAIKDDKRRAEALKAVRSSFDALRPTLSLTDYR